MFRLFKYIFILSTLIYGTLLRAQNVLINIVTEEAYPVQYTEDDEIKGPATELVKAIMAQAGLNYSINVMPWARTYQTALTQPNTLIYSIAKTEQRDDLFSWIGSVMNIKYSLVGLESLALKQPVTLNSLKELRVGVIRHSATHQHLSALGFKNLYLVTEASQSINMLKFKRIDLFTSNYASFQISCLHLKVDCQNIKQIYNLDKLATSLYLAFNKKTDKNIIEQVRAAYHHVIKSSKKHNLSILNE